MIAVRRLVVQAAAGRGAHVASSPLLFWQVSVSPVLLFAKLRVATVVSPQALVRDGRELRGERVARHVALFSRSGIYIHTSVTLVSLSRRPILTRHAIYLRRRDELERCALAQFDGRLGAARRVPAGVAERTETTDGYAARRSSRPILPRRAVVLRSVVQRAGPDAPHARSSPPILTRRTADSSSLRATLPSWAAARFNGSIPTRRTHAIVSTDPNAPHCRCFILTRRTTRSSPPPGACASRASPSSPRCTRPRCASSGGGSSGTPRRGHV